MKILFAC